MSYHDQKQKMEKKVKKHYDQIRSVSIKSAPHGAWSSRGKHPVEVNSQYDVFMSVFLFFRALKKG